MGSTWGIGLWTLKGDGWNRPTPLSISSPSLVLDNMMSPTMSRNVSVCSSTVISVSDVRWLCLFGAPLSFTRAQLLLKSSYHLNLPRSSIVTLDLVSDIDIVITCCCGTCCTHVGYLMLIQSSVTARATKCLKAIYSGSNLRTVQDSCLADRCSSIPTFSLPQTWNIFRKRGAFVLSVEGIISVCTSERDNKSDKPAALCLCCVWKQVAASRRCPCGVRQESPGKRHYQPPSAVMFLSADGKTDKTSHWLTSDSEQTGCNGWRKNIFLRVACRADGHSPDLDVHPLLNHISDAINEPGFRHPVTVTAMLVEA